MTIKVIIEIGKKGGEREIEKGRKYMLITTMIVAIMGVMRA